MGKSAQPGDGMYQLTWQPSQPWTKQKLIITHKQVVASDRRVHHTHIVLPALIRGMFGEGGNGEWTVQIATGAKPTIFIATIFMSTQSWAGGRCWGLRIPGFIADGWVDCTAHVHLLPSYNRRQPRSWSGRLVLTTSL